MQGAWKTKLRSVLVRIFTQQMNSRQGGDFLRIQEDLPHLLESLLLTPATIVKTCESLYGLSTSINEDELIAHLILSSPLLINRKKWQRVKLSVCERSERVSWEFEWECLLLCFVFPSHGSRQFAEPRKSCVLFTCAFVFDLWTRFCITSTSTRGHFLFQASFRWFCCFRLRWIGWGYFLMVRQMMIIR